MLRRGVAGHIQAHHPSPLRDLAFAHEPELRIEGFRTGVKVRTSLRWPVVVLLRIGLDHTTSGFADQLEGSSDRSAGHSVTPMLAAGEDAADTPVGKPGEVLCVRLLVVDPDDLRRRAELAPSDALTAAVHQDLVDAAVDEGPLRVTVRLPAALETFRMEPDTPAPAPHPVVGFDQALKIEPRPRVKRTGNVLGFHACHRNILNPHWARPLRAAQTTKPRNVGSQRRAPLPS